MIFFIVILIISLILGFYILHLDNKNNNILESYCNANEENNDNQNSKIANSCFVKEKINKDYNNNTIDEEKKLLHLSRLN